VIAELRDRVLPSWTPTARAPALTVYFEEGAGTREARRIAANIAKLPVLLRQASTANDDQNSGIIVQ
jgi:hypothetical protein